MIEQEVPSHGRAAAVDLAPAPLAVLGVTGLVGLLGWLIRRRPTWLAAAVLSQAGLAGLFWLFRSPARRTTSGAGLVVSPCDGVVTQINLAHESTFLDAVAYRITMRVRLRDAQVVRAPAQGIVRLRRYLPATLSDEPDDALWVGIRLHNAARVVTKLTASTWLRAAPSYWAQGIAYGPDLDDAVQTGQVVGRLSLGGTVTVYVPATAQITVGPGVCVRAGETVLARL